jgi:hypothetical protein
MFHDRVTEADLTVTSQGDFTVMSDATDRGSFKQWFSPLCSGALPGWWKDER